MIDFSIDPHEGYHIPFLLLAFSAFILIVGLAYCIVGRKIFKSLKDKYEEEKQRRKMLLIEVQKNNE